LLSEEPAQFPIYIRQTGKGGLLKGAIEGGIHSTTVKGPENSDHIGLGFSFRKHTKSREPAAHGHPGH